MEHFYFYIGMSVSGAILGYALCTYLAPQSYVHNTPDSLLTSRPVIALPVVENVIPTTDVPPLDKTRLSRRHSAPAPPRPIVTLSVVDTATLTPVYQPDKTCLVTFPSEELKLVEQRMRHLDIVCVSDITSNGRECQCYVWLPVNMTIAMLAYERWVSGIVPL